MIGAWVKVYCVRSAAGGLAPDIESLEGFGKQNVDYFAAFWTDSSSSIEFRLERGKAKQAAFRWNNALGALDVYWPQDSPKPTTLSLQVP